jgi:hypothetical protein
VNRIVRGITVGTLSLWALLRFGSTVAEPLLLSVPAGRAADTLVALGHQADLFVSYDYSLVSWQPTQPIKGRYELKEALRQMLRHSGLQFRIASSGSVFINAAPQAPVRDSHRQTFVDKPRSIESTEFCICALNAFGTRLGPWCWAGDSLAYRPDCRE